MAGLFGFQYECKDYQEALNVLDLVETNSLKPVAKNINFSINQSITESEPVNKNVSIVVFWFLKLW